MSACSSDDDTDTDELHAIEVKREAHVGEESNFQPGTECAEMLYAHVYLPHSVAVLIKSGKLKRIIICRGR
jgi:hypothetical protein